jgi:hypothetical protein
VRQARAAVLAGEQAGQDARVAHRLVTRRTLPGILAEVVAAQDQATRRQACGTGQLVGMGHECGRSDVFDYIERFYNPTRRHSTLGYVSPVQVEEAGKAQSGVIEIGSRPQGLAEAAVSADCACTP